MKLLNLNNVNRATPAEVAMIVKSAAGYVSMFQENGDTVTEVSAPTATGVKGIGVVVFVTLTTAEGWDCGGPVALNTYRCHCGNVGCYLPEGVAVCNCGAVAE